LKLSYTLELLIEKPVEDVIALFRNRELLSQWQPGLIGIKPLPENEGKPRYKLTFQLSRRKMVMTETIEHDQLPGQYDVNYEMKGVFNRVKNSFVPHNAESTKWITISEFQFGGLMSLIAPFIKNGFQKQSQMIMNNFKMFAEKAS
jgi:hypothetical protein